MAELTRDRLRGMTVAVTGASGNVGTALLRRLTDARHGVAEVRGLARRPPPDIAPYDTVQWHHTDLGGDPFPPADHSPGRSPTWACSSR